MAELSKITDKLGWQKIVNEVRSMIAPTLVVPEANRDDPMGYCLAELVKLNQEAVELHAKQSEVLARINSAMGALLQAYSGSKPKADDTKVDNTKADAIKPDVKADDKSTEPLS